MEAVIRRAVELQASSSPTGEGVSEGELVRIGGELGIPAAYLKQALAEVRSDGAPEHGLLASAFGEAQIGASRIVHLPAEQAQAQLERYLVECEHMLLQRRQPGWAVYERGSGIGAQLGRGLSSLKLINAPLIRMVVEAAEAGRSYVALSANLATARAGFATGALLGGGGGGLAAATVLGIAVAPVAAFAAVPLTAAVWWGMRAGYSHTTAQAGLRLESVLDRLESGELLQERKGKRWGFRLPG
jgi:hypothetical protein